MTTHSLGGQGGVPSSIPRPPNTLRHSLAPAAQGRQSIAPGGGGAFGGGRVSGRASMAPGAGAFADSQNSQSGPGASQGGSQFSQGHGGPPPQSSSHLVAPMTASRAGNVYTSFGASQSAAKAHPTLRTSMAATDYAPPRQAISLLYLDHRAALTSRSHTAANGGRRRSAGRPWPTRSWRPQEATSASAPLRAPTPSKTHATLARASSVTDSRKTLSTFANCANTAS